MKTNKIRKRLLVFVGVSAILVAVSFIVFTLNDRTPTDTKIVQILHENEASLLDIEGVVGAGIARDEQNYIIGIAVYVEDSMPDFQRIPSTLDGFQVVVKKMSETTEPERASMIIRKY